MLHLIQALLAALLMYGAVVNVLRWLENDSKREDS